MYTVTNFGNMIADRIRMQAIEDALRKHVRPSSIVIDIGTGTGICALLACRLGARKVYAIEPNDAIQLAKELAAANGFSDRIEFVQGLSTSATLAQLGDVIVSDLHGVLPLYQDHILSIADARQRLLVPGGALIPARDSLWAAVVEAPKLYQKFAEPWEHNNYGLDLRAARRSAINTWMKATVKREQLLTDPFCWGTLDYYSACDPNVSGEMSLVAKRPGIAHGLAVWFDAVLADGISFSNAPGESELIYGHAFFPLSAPVDLQEGDSVNLRLRADLVRKDYIWTWESQVMTQGATKAHFKQSDFFGMPLSASQLARQAAKHVPALNEEGEIDRMILEMMDGNTALETIASFLCNKFPHSIKTFHEALARAGEFSLRYSR